MSTASIVIAEHGTHWFDWTHRLQSHCAEVVVLVQDENEHAAAFYKRAKDRMQRLHDDGLPIIEAVFISGRNCGFFQRRERARTVRGLSTTLAQFGVSSLYLDDTSENVTARGRRLLTAMAWALNDLARGGGMTVSVTSPQSAGTA